MADEKAQFTEVLEIDVQVDKFSNNLNVMLQQFDKAMTALEARASKVNINPLSQIGSSISSADVDKAIKSINDSMDRFIQHQEKVMGALTNTIVESMDKITDSNKKSEDRKTKDSQEGSDKRKKIAKDEADEVVKTVETRAERIKRVTDEVLASKKNQTNLSGLATGEQSEILNNLLTAHKAGEFNPATNLSPANARYFENYQKQLLERIGAEKEANKATVVDSEQTWLQRTRIGQLYARVQNEIEAKRVADIKRNNEKILADDKATNDQRQRALRVLAQYQEAEERRVQSVRNQSSKAQSSYYDQYFKGTGYTKDASGFSGPGGGPPTFVPPNAEGVLPKLKQVREEIEKTAQSSRGFVATLTRDIPGLIANVIRFGLAWKALNAVIQTIVGIPQLIFAGFKQGIEYLDVIQQRTTDIKEALLENATFSSKWADNVHLAGDAARYATQQIQEFAARAALDPEKIEAGLKSLIQGGGLKLFNNDLKLAVETTGKLLSLLRARGVSDTNQRRFVQEINDLVTGQVKSTSAVLQVLGYSVAEWKEIRKHALDARDLYEQIEERLSGADERIGSAGDRWKDLLRTVTQYKNELAGALALPIFELLTSQLQQVKQYFEDHNTELQRMARFVGVVTEKVLEMGSALLKNGGIIGFLIGGFGRIATSISAMLVGLERFQAAVDNRKDKEHNERELAAATLSNPLEEVPYGGKTAAQTKFDEAEAKRKKAYEARQADMEKESKLLRDLNAQATAYSEKGIGTKLIEGLAGNRAYGPAEVIDPIKERVKAELAAADAAVQTALAEKRASIARKDSDEQIKKYTETYKKLQDVRKEAQSQYRTYFQPEVIDNTTKNTQGKENSLSELRGKFREELDETKLYYQQLRDATNEAVAERTKSHKSAAVAIGNSFAQEGQAVTLLTTKYKKLFETSGAKPEQIDSAKAAIQHQLEQFRLQAEKANSAARKGALSEDAKVEQEHAASILRIQAAQAKAELALMQQKAQSGYYTESQLADKRIEVNKREHDLNVAALENELKRTAKGTVEHQQTLDKLNEENQRYTNEFRLLTSQRIEALENEERRARQAQIDSAQLHSTTVQQDTEFANRHAENTAKVVANNKLLLDARRQEIDLAIRNAEIDLESARAKEKDIEKIHELTVALEKLRLERRANQLAAVVNAGSGTSDPNASRQAERKELQKQVDDAATAFADAQTALQDFKDSIKNNSEFTQEDADKMAELSQQVQDTGDALGGLEEKLGKVKGNFADKVIATLFGADFQSKWNDANGAVAKFAVAAQGAANLLGVIQATVDQYEQGRKKGGVLGGVGAVLASGPVSDLLSAIPVVGGFVKPLGAIFGFLGGLFTATAKKIAAEVKAQMDETLKQFGRGNLALKDAVAQLERERQDAIRRLSGQKGGQEQLNALLPQFDDQIAQLQQQAKQIIKTFDEEFAVLNLHSQDLGNLLKTWQDINKQVKEYIDAGGDAAKAAQFISLSLRNIKEQGEETLRSGEQQSIQDAIHLNDLLKQRIDLVKQFKKAEFDLINADALERRQPGAVTRAQQLSDLRKQHTEQLSQLDAEIKITAEKVARESKLFNLALDINALHRRDDALTLLALDAQIRKWTDIKKIVDGITFNPATGLYGITPGTPLGDTLGIPLPPPPKPPTPPPNDGGGDGPFGPRCFTPNTKVKTPNGDVPFGDMPQVATVLTKFGARTADLLVHEFEGEMLDMGNGELVTHDHMIERNGVFVPAEVAFPNAPRVPYVGLVYNFSIRTRNEDERHYLLANGNVAHNLKAFNGGVGDGNNYYRSYGEGGIVSKEQLIHVAEGDSPEAVIPLSGGRNVPVKLTGDWGRLADAISVLKRSDFMHANLEGLKNGYARPQVDTSALQPTSIMSSNIGSITVTVQGGCNDNPQQLANTIADEISRRARYGYKR